MLSQDNEIKKTCYHEKKKVVPSFYLSLKVDLINSAMHTLHHDCDEISDQGVPIIDLYLSLFYSFTFLSQGQQKVVAYYTVTKLITVRLLCHSVSL